MAEKGDLISVIVPIYNVEKYLRRCILSICSQTYTNIEIILVNDGSSDNSLEICKEYKAKDDRIRLINKENGGIGDARNAGIAIANGNYYVFVDSDDYIHCQMIELLYNAIIRTNSLMSVCSIAYVYEGESVEEKYYSQEEIKYKVISNIQAIREQYGCFAQEFVVVWNKMYHKKMFNNTLFRVGVLHEDDFISYKLLYCASNIVLVRKRLYYYLQRKNSIMGNRFDIRHYDKITAHEERLKFCMEKHIFADRALKGYLTTFKSFIDICKKNDMINKEKVECLVNEYNKQFEKYCRDISRFKRSLLCVYMFFMKPRKKIVNFLHRIQRFVVRKLDKC